MCKKLGIFLLALLVGSFSLWAFPGRATESQERPYTGTSVQEVQEEQLKTDSGKVLESILIKSSASLTDQELETLRNELVEARKDYEALKATSIEKDAMIDDLAAENAKMKDETGSKAYLMVDALMGFEKQVPEFGVGLTVGTRIGNSLMLEAGADYMLGNSLKDASNFSTDDLSFHAGIGWMF